MCSGSEAGSYLRRIDFVYHSTLGLRVIKKKGFGKAPGRGQRELGARSTPARPTPALLYPAERKSLLEL